jgi:5-methyltetrahydrofolate--homocysteine methyltransferase
MSGLLVKSTVVMKENLEEISSRGLAAKWPIILGGAALTRAFVEEDLAGAFDGVVRYAKDAFEGLDLMEPLVAVSRGADPDGVGLPPLKKRIYPKNTLVVTEPENMPERSDVARDNPIPAPPFWGSRIVKGFPLSDYAAFLDERATFMGQWGLKPGRGEDGASYEELVATDGKPRLRYWMDRLLSEKIMDPAVVYGYFPVVSDGHDVIVLHHGTDDSGVLGAPGILAPDGGSGGAIGSERLRFTFPRQRRDRHLCLADFVKPNDSGQVDVMAFQLVTAGASIDAFAQTLFAGDSYRDYLELNGLAMQLTEALAEYWHSQIRAEWGVCHEDPSDLSDILGVKYRGARFSLGYPACPDMEDRTKFVELLRPERIGVELSEELQLHPEQSTDAFVFHHPEAKYFSV